MNEKLYGIKEAAEYLSIGIPAIKHHVYNTHLLNPIRIGHSLVFTQAELDHFNQLRRKPGRPKKDETK